MLIEGIITFIILWFLSMIIHEFGHKIGAAIQGVDSYIKIWFFGPIPSMKCIPKGVLKDKITFYIWGGLFSAYMMLIPTIIGLLFEINWLFIPSIIIATIQFVYAIYEAIFIERLDIKTYMIWHYVLYLAVGLITLWLVI